VESNRAGIVLPITILSKPPSAATRNANRSTSRSRARVSRYASSAGPNCARSLAASARCSSVCGGSGRFAYCWIGAQTSPPAKGNVAAEPSFGTPVGASRITVPKTANDASPA